MSLLQKIDLNCDLGEQYGNFKSSRDDLLMPYLSSCNIACGFHSGDPVTIHRTIQLAKKHKVAIGAHPSFPDLQGFGRRDMALTAKEVYIIILYQVSAIKGMVEAMGSQLHHVKPHGALYNMASRNSEYAKAICQAVADIDRGLILYGLSDSIMKGEAEKLGLTFFSEVFIDRAYESDKSLRNRQYPDALLGQVAMLDQLELFITEKSVKTVDDEVLPLSMDTICLHSDSPDALETIEFISKNLRSHNIEITAD